MRRRKRRGGGGRRKGGGGREIVSHKNEKAVSEQLEVRLLCDTRENSSAERRGRRESISKT